MILSSTNLSATTAKPSIIEDIYWGLGVDSTQYPLADVLRNVNMWYYNTVTDIVRYNSNWEWVDTNDTNSIGTLYTLVNAQKAYTMPVTFLKLLRVEVKDAGGIWRKLHQFDESQVSGSLQEFMKTDGLPVYYRESGNKLELYPSPATGSVTMTDGLKIYHQLTQAEFTNASASVAPGFPANFHRILSLGAQYDYAISKLSSNTALITKLKEQIDEMRASVREYYTSRNREVRPKLSPRRRNYE